MTPQAPYGETERLILRPWRDSDRTPLAAMGRDAEVMRWFPSTLTGAESNALFDKLQQRWADDGFSFAALERKADAAFIGFVGLSHVAFAAPFTPAVEIGWRLACNAWGHGYASEGAAQALAWSFRELGLKEIISFTAAGNMRSRAVMERIGMRRDKTGDFDHPSLDSTSPLRRHVLYRIANPPLGQA